MLKDIGMLLQHIYKKYFPQELVRLVRNHQKDTEKSLYNFLRDFEIFPGKTKKSQILHIFVFTREQPAKIYQEFLTNHVIKRNPRA